MFTWIHLLDDGVKEIPIALIGCLDLLEFLYRDAYWYERKPIYLTKKTRRFPGGFLSFFLLWWRRKRPWFNELYDFSFLLTCSHICASRKCKQYPSSTRLYTSTEATTCFFWCGKGCVLPTLPLYITNRRTTLAHLHGASDHETRRNWLLCLWNKNFFSCSIFLFGMISKRIEWRKLYLVIIIWRTGRFYEWLRNGKWYGLTTRTHWNESNKLLKKKLHTEHIYIA